MSKSVTLTVPDLHLLQGSTQKELAWVLSKAIKQAASCLFNPAEGLSPAALVATFTGRVKSKVYCLVSPIECYADQKTVYIVNKASLSVEDQNKIIATLNQFLQQDDIRLEMIAEGLWLFEMKNHTDVVMRSLDEVLGKSMDAQLPTGIDEVYWRRLLTECQMLLSQTISVWFWGNGVDSVQLKTHFDGIYTDDFILHAKAHNAGVKAKNLPAAWTTAMLGNDNHLLITPTEIVKFEEKWLSPILIALKSGVLQTLTLRIDQQTEYVLARRYCYYFWKKIKPITAFLSEGNRSIQ
jgi:hypothetical protein